ncbi:hypothetical protein F383_08450 [Gossypium arboreum]|uniref:Uncharacterized protein n=1 Tax=Gossypium arboreum TaxID=29729 RepID=A0A0B0PKH0_GOSAR|nr:hypothetical protein F383_08450 [Gossypium arboreum]
MPYPRYSLIQSFMPMPCPRHGLTLALISDADAMSQTWSYTGSH